MKKFLLALAFVCCAASVSAQSWGLGARINAGVQLQGEYTFSTENYLDARLGINFPDGLDLDLTLIYQWHIGQWDWTPKAGTWFFDAGLGAQAALLMHDDGGLYAGAVGDAKFGIKFNKVPIKLSIDYTPGIGCLFADDGGLGFRPWNFGLSCVYCF
ncbi:MAG: hypothetical protein IIV28_02815 [Alistipes sp.]|jgi:hypothetical protein|nr:hypothetical protein [Alistipes sp.]